ncbi:MAG: carboxymuconolactone decarboxylase family protein [Pseudomonadota bacterium]
MERLGIPAANALTQEQQAVYDKVVNGPRGRIAGALQFWLHRPELADRAQELGLYLRFDTSLPARLSELAILVTVRHWGAEFEWIHGPIAIKAGLSSEAVEALKMGQKPLLENDDEVLVYEITRDVLLNKHLSDALYARGMDLLGQDAMVDLVGIIGYYTLIALTLNTFDVLPESREPGWSKSIGID